MFQTWV